MRRRGEAGESLVEILIAIVIMGLAMGAIFATYNITARLSNSSRDLVAADSVLRSAAELTKKTVRDSCGSGSPSYAVSPAALAALGTSRVKAPASISGPCPSTTSPQAVTLTVTWPDHSQSMDIDVRTP